MRHNDVPCACGWRLDGDLALKGYGDPFRTYNVLPNALLVNYKAIRYQFGTYPDGDGVLVTTDPVLANLEIVNRLSLAGGMDVIHDHLALRGLNTDSLVIDNGAGLSRKTRISAQLLADMLELAYQPPYGAESET